MATIKENPSATSKKDAIGRKSRKNASQAAATRQGVGIANARRGVRPQSYERAENVRKKVGFTQQEFAGLLGIDPRTYSRRAKESLRSGESIQVEMLDAILQEATRVFRDEQLARTWMRSPIISLDNERPMDHLDSIEGYERVKDTLGKIDYGMY